jgi:hypothetical protein
MRRVTPDPPEGRGPAVRREMRRVTPDPPEDKEDPQVDQLPVKRVPDLAREGRGEADPAPVPVPALAKRHQAPVKRDPAPAQDPHLAQAQVRDKLLLSRREKGNKWRSRDRGRESRDKDPGRSRRETTAERFRVWLLLARRLLELLPGRLPSKLSKLLSLKPRPTLRPTHGKLPGMLESQTASGLTLSLWLLPERLLLSRREETDQESRRDRGLKRSRGSRPPAESKRNPALPRNITRSTAKTPLKPLSDYTYVFIRI